MPDDKYIPYLRNPRGPRNPQYRTPIEELDYHYKNKMGVFQNRPSPTPDLEPGAVRRGAGDIWSRVRDELRNIKQGAGIMGRGFGEAASEVGRTTGVTQFGQGAIKAGKEVGQTLQRLNLGPQGDTWLTINDPFARKKAEAAPSPAVPTTETGAPASTYDRGEGAPTGTTRLQQQIQAGIPPAGMGQRTTGNRYLDMYYAGAAAQQKYLGGLPEGQAPIEVLRGTQRTFFSPTTKKEYGTELEAAFGQAHKPEMARLIAKETAAAKHRPYPYQFEKLTDPKTFEEKIVALDPNTGAQLTGNQIDPDVQAAMEVSSGFERLSEDEQDEKMKNMKNARQRQLLIQIIRQLAQEQGGK